jgi:uncharacterized integral membrane protein (TIGR00697 family)
MQNNSAQLREKAFRFYLVLTGLFIASLVACNLIFQKFFYWTPLAFLDPEGNSELLSYTFQISVGIIPYPLTFLVTDLISEIYGRKRADQVVYAGLVASLLLFVIVYLADAAPAVDFSPVSDAEFSKVFGRTGVAVAASMVAYLVAQFIDIRIFHFWKRVTRGKHLWVRNNFSTITSQLIDTAIVLVLLCALGTLPWAMFTVLFLNGFIFKAIVALLDTPVFYLATWYVRKKLGLKLGEEFEL